MVNSGSATVCTVVIVAALFASIFHLHAVTMSVRGNVKVNLISSFRFAYVVKESCSS